jgi:outer membrane protein OmpA-like peptidoglycan-associated protein
MMNIKKKLAVALLAPLFLLPFGNIAHAINSINVQTFNPSTSDHFVFLEDGYKSEWPKTASLYFGANYNYYDEPLIALDPTQTFKQFTIISSIQTFDLFFGFKVANNFGLFLGAPIHFINYSASSPANFPKGSASGFGDIKIEGKIRITDDSSPTSIALIPEFHLPTGSTQNFVSDASTYVGIRAAIERQFDTFTLIGNIGFAAAANAIYQDQTFVSGIDYRKRLIVGIGGYLPFTDQWGMNLEFNNISMIPFDKTLNPNDAYVGLRYAANDSFVLTGGGAVGKIGGPSGSDYRLVAGVRYTIFKDPKQLPQPVKIIQAAPAPVVQPLPVSAPAPALVAPIIASNQHATMRANKIEINTPISFTNNSYTLAPDSRQILDDVSSLMLSNKSAYKKVLVDGHTSGTGTDDYNMKLSIARARSVRSYLITKGVPGSALEAHGYGMRKPKVKKNAPHAEEINRRVEFNIVK